MNAYVEAQRRNFSGSTHLLLSTPNSRSQASGIRVAPSSLREGIKNHPSPVSFSSASSAEEWKGKGVEEERERRCGDSERMNMDSVALPCSKSAASLDDPTRNIGESCLVHASFSGREPFTPPITTSTASKENRVNDSSISSTATTFISSPTETTGTPITTTTGVPLSSLPSSSYATTSSVSAMPRVKKIFFDKDEGLSPELGGFGHYAGSITAFMDPDRQKTESNRLGKGGGGMGSSPLPCEVAEAQERAMRAQQVHAASIEEVIQKGGSLPSPKRRASGAYGLGQGDGAEGTPCIQLSSARKPPSFLQNGAEAALGHSISRSSSSSSSSTRFLGATSPAGNVAEVKKSSCSPLSSQGVERTARPWVKKSEGVKDGGSSERQHQDGVRSFASTFSSASSITTASFASSSPTGTPSGSNESKRENGRIDGSTILSPDATAASTKMSSSFSPSSSLSTSTSETPFSPDWTKEAEDYYRSLPKNPLTKEEMWERIQAANADKQERLQVGRNGIRERTNNKDAGNGGGPISHLSSPFSSSSSQTSSFSSSGVALDIAEVDMIKMREELKEHDRWHYELGEYAFKDEEEETKFWFRGKLLEEEEGRVMVARQRRYDYYTMWSLAMALNKARWNMLEVHSQRGVKTTGAGMKLLFWKEAIRGILQSGSTTGTNFTDSHPVLQPFSRVVSRHPKLTKAFVRGFTDARLRTLQQPANMQQLFDHFDKFYGYFYNTLLEVTQLQDEAAEHALVHIGRATGLTQHCVMFWKKYAALGVTLLPADMCADHCVHLGLLKRLSLASRDRAVRRLLCDVMGVAKTEMLHAEKLAKDIHPKTWPILMECLYPNYYLNFLQKRDFNVSAMFADYNIENMGFIWFRIKKRLEWQREQSIAKLLSDAAPVPILNRPIFYRGSAYKMATHTRGSVPT